jgi:hypothetical protein
MFNYFFNQADILFTINSTLFLNILNYYQFKNIIIVSIEKMLK